MSFAQRYGFNKKSAEQGQWVTMGDGLDLQLRRLSSKFVRDFVSKENKKYANLTKGGKNLPQDIADLVNRRVGAYAVLVDWRDTPTSDDNPEGKQGAPRNDAGELIPFSPEHAVEMFIEYPDFLDDVIEQSSIVDNFRDEEREATEGNF